MEYIIYFALDATITSFILWVASKITSVELFFKETVIAACLASLASLTPDIGEPASAIVLFYLLKRFSSAPIWPDLILMVAINKLLSAIALLLSGNLFL